MENIILLLVAVLPIYIIGLYIYKKDKDKESKKLLSKLFIFGIISCFPAVILELIIGSFFPSEEQMNLTLLFIYVFVSVALIEEFCKFYMTYKIAYNHKEFNHIYDAIVYSVFVSLGFAAFENILYVMDAGLSVGLMRAFSAIPGHACDAIIMGNYLGLSKIAHINNKPSLAKKNLILSILLPTVAHTIYDYCLFTGKYIFIIIFLAMLIWIYIYSIKKVKKISNIERNFIDTYLNYCPICGTKGKGKYCVNCGNNLTKEKLITPNDLTQ